jgi:hypothetical protein
MSDSLQQQQRGIVYIVTGSRKYYSELKKSVDSLLKQGYNGSIRIVAENASHISAYRFNRQIEIYNVPKNKETSFSFSRKLKTQLYDYSPFAETLYLDTDTEILKPIDDIWNYLNDSNFVLATDILETLEEVSLKGNYLIDDVVKTRTVCPPDSKHFNAGVILFRRCGETKNLFEHWTNEWSIFRDRDQLALIRAIFHSRIKVRTLPNLYNAWYFNSQNISEVVVYHYWQSKKPVTPLMLRVLRWIKPMVPQPIVAWHETQYKARELRRKEELHKTINAYVTNKD